MIIPGKRKGTLEFQVPATVYFLLQVVGTHTFTDLTVRYTSTFHALLSMNASFHNVKIKTGKMKGRVKQTCFYYSVICFKSNIVSQAI